MSAPDTRTRILERAMQMATVDGLDGVTIGKLSSALGMSKSGVYAHFGSKQDLQLATVEQAAAVFRTEVLDRGLHAEPGLAQLLAVCDGFVEYLERQVFPGGCFFATVAMEMGSRPGPVRERVAAVQAGFMALVHQFAVTAVERGQLGPDEDPTHLAFELNGIVLATQMAFVLSDDPTSLDTARSVVRRRLGVGSPS